MKALILIPIVVMSMLAGYIIRQRALLQAWGDALDRALAAGHRLREVEGEIRRRCGAYADGGECTAYGIFPDEGECTACVVQGRDCIGRKDVTG